MAAIRKPRLLAQLARFVSINDSSLLQYAKHITYTLFFSVRQDADCTKAQISVKKVSHFFRNQVSIACPAENVYNNRQEIKHRQLF